MTCKHCGRTITFNKERGRWYHNYYEYHNGWVTDIGCNLHLSDRHEPDEIQNVKNILKEYESK